MLAQTPNGNGNNGNQGNNPQPVPLVIKQTNPGSQFDKPLKSPVQIPEVWQDGHSLYFDASIEGCTVQLLDENENVIFSDSIDENQTSLTLPEYLTGTYELQIVRGSITFYCEIEL
ncbi:MAG: hypothetical protein IJ064_02430 [Bacteroidaceae bacterium]|nr:hypothetical protein [Bacteroidaceae bacterium]